MRVLNGLKLVQREFKNQRICFGVAQCVKLIVQK